MIDAISMTTLRPVSAGGAAGVPTRGRALA